MMRWAILGTGAVSRKFVRGLKPLRGQMLVSVVASRKLENARRFATGLGVAHSTEDYASAVARPDVDAVYIATPPSEHEAHALQAIAAGKAVLIEKPFAFDARAAERIVDAAKAAGVFCMEAMWTRFLPLLSAVRENLAGNALGEVRSLQGSFMASNAPDDETSLFDPMRGGGALMHRGIYPLSLAWHLLGPVADVKAIGRIGASGVDEDCSLILQHDSGAVSTILASLRAPGPNTLIVSGTHGRLDLAAPVFRPYRAVLTPVRPRQGGGQGMGSLAALREGALAQWLNQRVPYGLREALGRGKVIRKPYAGNGYHYEAAEVALRVRRKETFSPLMPPEESVAIMAVMDAARAQFA